MSDNALRQALSYRRFTGAPRILVFDSSYYVIRDVIEGAAELGCAVFTQPARGKGRGADRFIEELLLGLVAHRPDFVFTVNHLGFDEQGVLAQLLARYEIPLASWFVDHPLPILGGAPGNVTPFTQIFCVERTALPWLAELGYPAPRHLPTASNPRYFHPDRVPQDQAAAHGAPLSFVGQSWWGIARGEPSAEERAAAEALLSHHDMTRDYVSGPIYAELPALDLGLGDDQSPRIERLRRRSRAAYVALAEASLRGRRALMAALAPLSPRIYGDEGWAEVAPGLSRHPQPDPVLHVPAIYAGAAINLNHTSANLPTGLNLRVWDVPAVGGFLLTDAQPELREHFADNEVVTYGSPEEAAERARHYLAHAEERQAIARRARARIEAAHQYPHRLARLDAAMRERYK